jgi:hypothetical protein
MSDSTSESTTQTQQTDNRRVIGQGGISAENSTVTVLDNGAVSKAFDFGTGVARAALDFSNTAQAASLSTLKDAATMVKDAYADAKGRGALTDYILIGAVAMAGIVAYQAVKK